MTTYFPNLTREQSAIIIASIASTAQVIAQAYRAELGIGRASEYEAFAARMIRDTRNAIYEGISIYEESAIIEETEHLIAEALAG